MLTESRKLAKFFNNSGEKMKKISKNLVVKLLVLAILGIGTVSLSETTTHAQVGTPNVPGTCDLVPAIIANFFNCSGGEVGIDFCVNARVARDQCNAQYPPDPTLSNWEERMACLSASGINQCE
jgi:hypothetical protein